MLILPDGKFNRAGVMLEAHRQYAAMRRFGWSWSRCLGFAWAKARAMRAAATLPVAAEEVMMHAVVQRNKRPERGCSDGPFFVAA